MEHVRSEGEDPLALPAANSRAKPNRPRPRQPTPIPQRATPPETVDPRWILKALAAVFAVGLLCAYLTLCLFFYFGQWQFVLHPSRAVPQTPATLGLAFQPVRFADDLTGQPQLTAWWIPSDSPADPTVLLLHSETGSMSDALPAAKALHDARLNVFLFDYRGYGGSSGPHPTESRMQADASYALIYLLTTRRVAPSSLLIFGQNLAASLAVKLCRQHSDLAGLILLSADGDTLTRVQTDQRSQIVPMGLLFHERFPLADPLSTLLTPKLLISYTRAAAPEEAQRAADPKLTVELPPNAPSTAVTATIRRFLETYIPTPPTTLSPQHRL